MSVSYSMNCKIIAWNIGGAGSAASSRALKLIVKNYNPDFLFVLEPQVSGGSANKICERMGFPNIMRVEAEGRKGGIWLCWNAAVFQLQVLSACSQHLSVIVSAGSSPKWLLTAVYASPHQSQQHSLWRALHHTSQSNDLPWILSGDFNAILKPEEKSGHPSPSTLYKCRVFSDRVNQAELIDLGFSGPRFTWTRGDNPNTYKASRIDRSLCNTMWNSCFPNTSVKHLPRLHSDHHPILTTIGIQGVNSSVTRPFRFEAAWLTSNVFDQVVEGGWDHQASLPAALEKMATNLNHWNKTSFGSIFHKKRRLMARIHGIQEKMATSFSLGLFKLQTKLERELDEVLEQEELFWFQRSREKWVQQGERNTGYFHNQAIIRRRRNNINSLKGANGEWISDPQELADWVFNVFASLFVQDDNNYEDLMPRGAFPRLSQEDFTALLRPFGAEDIYRAIHEMKPLQAPGPDGFHAAFYQREWRVVGKSLINMAMEFFNAGGLPENVTDSTVVLIPKVEHPEMASQLRPISLNNVCLKAITKAITNRLKPIMRKLVSPRQSSFIPGRQTTDNIIVLQEVLHTLRKKKGKRGGIVMKIDLEKAYDRLRWDFLRDTLKEMGLPSSWIGCIMYCVEHNRMRLLWNGELSQPITPSRGVRQGDPLSPYLFVLCMERLSHRIDRAVQDKLWRPLKLSKDGPPLSHLFFADDLVLFAEAGGSQIRIIKQCLDDFCSSSGQRVNFHKSAMFVSANICRRQARSLSARMEIPLTVDLGRYLGVMAIHGRVTRGRYQDLFLKIQRKLAPWKAKQLSLAARLTLVKSVTASIPVYPMQVELMPKMICKSLDRVNRGFLWGDSEEKKKLHLVRWQQLTLPKEQGGLGLRPAREVNLAMLAKCGWRLLTEKETLWAQLMRSKYGKGRENLDIIKPLKGSSFTWNSISKAGDLLKKGCGWNIHRGNLTRFWSDIWILQVPLKEVAISPIPEEEMNAMVADYVDEEGTWLTEKFEDFLPESVTHKITARAVDPLTGESDVLFWHPTSDGKFSAKSAYQLTQQPTAGEPNSLWKNIWSLPVPERVRCFLWLVAHEKVSCNVQRVKRKITSSPFCYRCQSQEETSLHIFRDCPPAAFFWARTVPTEKQGDFFSMQLRQWLMENLQTEETPGLETPWKAFFSIAIWSLWKNRNEGVFKGSDKTLSPPSLTQAIKIKANLWHKAWMAPMDVLGRCSAPAHRTLRDIGWIPPPAGWMKMNVDGAANGTQGPAGAGGALRDHLGRWNKGFVVNLGTCSAVQAELWGIYHGLGVAWQAGSRTLIVESDSQLALQLIEKRNDPIHPQAAILTAIRRRLAQDWVVKLVHTYREGNRVADWLSKHSLVYPYGKCVLDLPPQGLNSILSDDTRGQTFPREVVDSARATPFL
ncbi:unnamed protein product [Linum trigynum]|uniref:Uncharacterized protein n=1 Tax=Linum trigynum TaxID=586398 RepID=A0AAV2D1P8_9ROSI